MQTALRVNTTVKSGGRIEIRAPQLRSGEKVEVIVLMSETPAAARRSVIDILAEAPGHRIFKTAEDVAIYLSAHEV